MVLLGVFSSVFAQDSEPLTMNKKEEINNKLKEGWTPKLKFVSNLSLSSSNKVVGQTTGDTKTVGVKIEAGSTYKSPTQEWRHLLNISGASTTTPALPRWVKSEDKIKYETIYLKKLESHPWLGPYVKASVETSMFKGEDIQKSDKNYQTIDGANLGTKSTQTLTEAFKPMTTKKSVGFFAKMIDRKNTNLELRLGLGALQVKAKDQFIVDDESTTDTVIQLKTLDDYSDVGIEAGLDFTGKWDERSSYSVKIETLTPMGSTDDLLASLKKKSTIELTNVNAVAGLTNKISDWMNISFEYKAIYQPKLVDEWQLQTGLVLNFVYDMY